MAKLLDYPTMGQKVRYLGGITGEYEEHAQAAFDVGGIYEVVEYREVSFIDRMFLGVPEDETVFCAVFAKEVEDGPTHWHITRDEFKFFELVY